MSARPASATLEPGTLWVRVVTDWTVSLFFRRDIAQLGTLGHPNRLD